MKNQLADVAQRRRALLQIIEAQRLEVVVISQQWQKPLVLVDAGLKAVRFVRGHPGLVSGSFAALLSLRGMGIAGVVQKGWRLLYLYPAVFSFGLKFLSSFSRSPSEKRNTEINY